MISEYFPQLDKRIVERLLRDGLPIDLTETSLLHAASRLTQLGILKTTEIHYIRCVNPGDGDFPMDVLDERCMGRIPITTLDQPGQTGQAQQSKYSVYHCPECGRLLEYPGIEKTVFRSWHTQIRPGGLADYEKQANEALSALAQNYPSFAGAMVHQLTALDLLSGEPSALRRRLMQTPQNRNADRIGPIHHRRRQDLIGVSEGLLDAYPTKSLFAQMLRFELNIDLDAVALGDNLTEIVNSVVLTAEREGWLPRLIEAAQRANRGNHQLLQLR